MASVTQWPRKWLLGAALLALAVACQWAVVGERHYACNPDGTCPEGRVCKVVEMFDGRTVCVPPGVKPLRDGGTAISDGGVELEDGGVIPESPDSGIPDSGIPDSGIPDSGVPDSGIPDSGSCPTLGWNFSALFWVTGYPARYEGYNLFFVTEGRFSGNLGGIDGANEICRQEARDAGLWSPETFVAFLEAALPDGGHNLLLPDGGIRLRADAGFIRSDGLPVAPGLAAMVSGDLWYPVAMSARGSPVDVLTSEVWTGLKYASGAIFSAPENCASWTTSLGPAQGRTGDPFASSLSTFAGLAADVCSSAGGRRLYCAQLAGHCAPPPPERPPGARLAVLTDSVPFDKAERACEKYEAAAGRPLRPLLAHTNRTAIEVGGLRADGGVFPPLNLDAGLWVRPDNVVVTTTTRSLTEPVVLAPIDRIQLLDGGSAKVSDVSNDRSVWTGVPSLTSMIGTTSSTCDDWMRATDADSGTPYLAGQGNGLSAIRPWWAGVLRQCGVQPAHVYCLEP